LLLFVLTDNHHPALHLPPNSIIYTELTPFFPQATTRTLGCLVDTMQPIMGVIIPLSLGVFNNNGVSLQSSTPHLQPAVKYWQIVISQQI